MRSSLLVTHLFTHLLAGLAVTGVVRADYITIDVDGDTSDWADVTPVTDPEGDDVNGHHDLTAVSVANDSTNLYFMLEVSGEGGDFFGNSSRIEELIIYFDTDNDAGTGVVIGPDGGQIGAEYSVSAARRVRPGDSNDTNYEGSLHTGDSEAGGTLVGNFSNTGLLKTAERGGVDAVTEFETMAPLFQLAGVDVGGTIAYTVRAIRSGTSPQQDWLDTPQTYTLQAVPEPATLGLLGLGGLLLGARR